MGALRDQAERCLIVIVHISTETARKNHVPLLKTKIWSLRVILELAGFNRLVDREDIEGIVLNSLGLTGDLHPDHYSFDTERVLVGLEKAFTEFEQALQQAGDNSLFGQSLSRLSEFLQLNSAKQSILEFVLLLQIGPCLRAATGYCGHIHSMASLHYVLAVIQSGTGL